MSALATPASWLPARSRRLDVVAGGDGSSSEERAGLRAFRGGLVAGRNGSSTENDRRAAGLDHALAGESHGASTRTSTGVAARGGLDAAIVGFNAASDVAVRRSARTLHAACAELLPGYAAATRERWRQALLTSGCLDGPPRRASARRTAPPLIVEHVVQPSDVLCALWLARRCGLFCPGSACGDGVGLRSACDIVPSFAPDFPPDRRAEVLEVLRANTAWRAHRLARGAAVA